MDISLDDIRILRQTLNVHRIAHEQMVARMMLLRKVSRQTRLSAIRAEMEQTRGGSSFDSMKVGD